MIVVRLIGGMGNQMFQYAVARSLALKQNVPVKLDLRDFKTYRLHHYALDKFAIQADEATSQDLEPFPITSHNLVSQILQKVRVNKHKRPVNYIVEPHFHFAKEILDLPDNIYLDGYWQSPKYWRGFEDKIRQELTVKNHANAMNTAMLKEIHKSMAVALHIRRGDYVTNKHTNEHHGTVPLDYYKRAVNYLLKHGVKNPHFYVFSDDPAWVKQNLVLDFPTTYVTHNDRDHGFEDLRLMTHCHHFIIANSTFSWWGAWLSPAQSKIVIAPKNWFAQYDYHTNDLIPPDWIQL